jgi:hypothetical protein
MTVTEARDRATHTVEAAMDRLPDLFDSARTGAEQVAEHLPEAVERARVGAYETTTTLQTMPDPTLRLLAAASLGLGAGLYLAGKRRLITLVALAPALILAVAIVTRPGRYTRPSR